MKAKHTTKRDNLDIIINNLKGLSGASVEVGVLEGAHQWLAGIHEYGCDIRVTDKMRAFLHYNGLHLSPNTTVIHIPERSFLRTGHDANIDTVLEKASRAIGQVIEGKMSKQQYLDLIGQQLATKIKEYAVQLSSPPNHPFTVERKGSSNPLVSTGDLIGGITWRTED